MDRPRETSLLILSDMHFGSFSEFADVPGVQAIPENPRMDATPVTQKLVGSVRKAGIRIDGILVTGDLTSKARPSEFYECIAAVNEVRHSLGVEEKSVLYTFGNHDTDWVISRLADATDQRPSDHRYKDVAASVGAAFTNPNPDMSSGPVLGSGVIEYPTYRVIIANTGYYSTHDQQTKQGKLGRKQYDWLSLQLQQRFDKSRWTILMLHHHPFNYSYPSHATDISCLDEGAELVDMIGQSDVDLVCHGHRHHPKHFTVLQNGWLHPVTFFCAGSVAVDAQHRSNGKIPNLYHVITLQTREPTGAAVGVIRSFEFSISKEWIPTTYSNVVPLDPVQKFGSCATESAQRALIEHMLNDLLEASDSNYCELPTFGNLPVDLQCMPLLMLNKAISEIADILMCRVIGKYDDEVVLQRRN